MAIAAIAESAPPASPLPSGSAHTAANAPTDSGFQQHLGQALQSKSEDKNAPTNSADTKPEAPTSDNHAAPRTATVRSSRSAKAKSANQPAAPAKPAAAPTPGVIVAPVPLPPPVAPTPSVAAATGPDSAPANPLTSALPVPGPLAPVVPPAAAAATDAAPAKPAVAKPPAPPVPTAGADGITSTSNPQAAASAAATAAPENPPAISAAVATAPAAASATPSPAPAAAPAALSTSAVSHAAATPVAGASSQSNAANNAGDGTGSGNPGNDPGNNLSAPPSPRLAPGHTANAAAAPVAAASVPAPAAATPAGITPAAAPHLNSNNLTAAASANPQPAASTPANPQGMAAWQSTSAAQSAAPRGELTLAMQTDALGTVQVRASLHNNLVGATVAVDRPEVHTFLATQMPALERSLAAKQIQMGSLNLQQNGAGNSGGQAMPQSGAQPQPRNYSVRSQPAPAAAPAAPIPLADVPASATGGSLLNLRA